MILSYTAINQTLRKVIICYYW